MILHLTPGSGSVELHIHDHAQVALYRPDDRPALVQTEHASSSRPAPRWFVAGLAGAVCLALGYGFAPRGSAMPTRVAGAVSQARPKAPLPSNLPLVPSPALLPEPETAVAVPPVRPRAEVTPADGVPAAVARQLAQAPVVVPPVAPGRPAAGSSAFGLEN